MALNPLGPEAVAHAQESPLFISNPPQQVTFDPNDFAQLTISELTWLVEQVGQLAIRVDKLFEQVFPGAMEGDG